LRPSFDVLPLLNIIHPENILDIVVISDDDAPAEIVTCWLNASQLENIEDTFVNTEVVSKDNGLLAVFVVLPLLNFLQPENILSIVVIFDTFEILTFWLNAAQL
jgi:hypothetical protein